MEIGGQKLTESTGWIHVLPTQHVGGDGWVPSPLPSQGCTCISSAPSFCVSLKSGGKQPSWIRACSVKLPDVPSLSAVPQSSVRIQNTCSSAEAWGGNHEPKSCWIQDSERGQSHLPPLCQRGRRVRALHQCSGSWTPLLELRPQSWVTPTQLVGSGLDPPGTAGQYYVLAQTCKWRVEHGG